MALAAVLGSVVSGVAGAVVRVEVEVADGLPAVGVVGLPDASVNEARWRVRSALGSAGCTWPPRRITISLSPAEVRKQGAGLDLPMAVGILAASEQIPLASVEGVAFLGEVGLDGRLRAPRGVLASALAVRHAGVERIVVPSDAVAELSRLPGLAVLAADSLAQVVEAMRAPEEHPPMRLLTAAPAAAVPRTGPDLADVRGHAHARLALEVAAAGAHHLAFVGAPGVGKTLLVDRLAGLLPDLDEEAALEVAVLYSVAGADREGGDYWRPPARGPHHSASSAAVLGSVRGSRVVPGAVTLAHRGVLVLDEAPEFARPALEGLRQPLEAGTVALDRAGWVGVAPARFQLALTANPCPCGQRIGTGAGCSCSPAAVRRYAARLSGPLMDRIDIRLGVGRPTDGELAASAAAESSAQVRERVCAARARAATRLAGTPWSANGEVPGPALRRRLPLPDDAGEVLRSAERRAASLRGPDRVLRMAWTVADLAGRERPAPDDVAVALMLRGMATPWAA